MLKQSLKRNLWVVLFLTKDELGQLKEGLDLEARFNAIKQKRSKNHEVYEEDLWQRC
jgi:hypothetical protein